MLPTHEVPCPRCGKGLYSALSSDDAVNAAVPEAPKLQRDEGGYYIRCPHCASRIAMVKLRSGSASAVRPAR
jgi:DNA-directed RNA polymerase subunit RPC12/RpoP